MNYPKLCQYIFNTIYLILYYYILFINHISYFNNKNKTRIILLIDQKINYITDIIL